MAEEGGIDRSNDHLTLFRSNDHLDAKPEGRVNMSASTVQQLLFTNAGLLSTQNSLLRGKPFEDLEKADSVNRHIVYVSQSEDMDFTNQNEAGQLKGVPLEANLETPHDRKIGNEAVTTKGVIRNETAEEQSVAEAQNVNKVNMQEIPLALYQQQMMLNHQTMLQQQQTVNSLIGKVDSLTKLVEQKDSAALTTEETPVKLLSNKKQSKVRAHTISDSSEGDITSDSDNCDSDSDSGKSDSSEETNRKSKEQSEQTSVENKSKDNSKITGNMKLLKEMGKEFEKVEAVGEKVNETLSVVVDSGIRSQIDRNVAKELCSKYQRPENCKALRVPRINKELWNTTSLIKYSKEQDKAFQIAQKYLNQGLIPLVQLMDILLKEENSESKFLLARDSFQLLAYAHRDMSNLRRQSLKSVVSDKYKQLCNDSTPLTENLLGDELEKQIKTLDEMRKVGKDLPSIRRRKGNGKGMSEERSSKYPRYNYGYSGYRNKDKAGGQSFLGKKARFSKLGTHRNNNRKNQKQ